MTVQTDLFDGMVADVISITNRPDLSDETALAVRTATVNCHLSDAYARDVQVSSIQLPAPVYATGLDISALFPKLRGLSLIQAMDVNYQPIEVTPESRMKVIELSDVYDSYGALRNNIAYIAGNQINIRSLVNSYGFFVTWFNLPEVKRDTYNSWIASIYPDAILYWAASIVLDTNGNEAKAAKLMRLTQEVNIPFLKANFLLGEQR